MITVLKEVRKYENREKSIHTFT